MLQVNGRPKQVGIVSWTKKCARPYSPDVYASVPPQTGWIHRTMAEAAAETQTRQTPEPKLKIRRYPQDDTVNGRKGKN